MTRPTAPDTPTPSRIVVDLRRLERGVGAGKADAAAADTLADAVGRLLNGGLAGWLARSDAFLCGNATTRDVWLGYLTAIGRVDPDRYAGDPTLRSFVVSCDDSEVGVVPATDADRATRVSLSLDRRERLVVSMERHGCGGLLRYIASIGRALVGRSPNG